MHVIYYCTNRSNDEPYIGRGSSEVHNHLTIQRFIVVTGYNMTCGGTVRDLVGHEFTCEHRENISKALTGKPKSDVVRKNMSLANKGRLSSALGSDDQKSGSACTVVNKVLTPGSQKLKTHHPSVLGQYVSDEGYTTPDRARTQCDSDDDQQITRLKDMETTMKNHQMKRLCGRT